MKMPFTMSRFFFFFAARIKRNLGKTEKNRKTRNENAPLLGGDIGKLIGFKSVGCSRQMFGCLQKILTLGCLTTVSPLTRADPPGRVNYSERELQWINTLAKQRHFSVPLSILCHDLALHFQFQFQFFKKNWNWNRRLISMSGFKIVQIFKN